MLKVAIIGSRQRTDRHEIEAAVADLPPDAVVVTGGATGPDSWAEAAARDRGLDVVVFRPDLTGVRNRGEASRRYHDRNQRIIDEADEVIAFVAAERKGGTEDAIRRAQRRGIPVTLR